MPKPNPQQPPLPIGTPVEINIAQGLAVARGVVTAAEDDAGWMYCVDVTGGDNCDAHRNAAGELWVCKHEVKPAATVGISHLPCTVEIVGNLVVLLDEDGNGCDCQKLTGLRAVKRQLRRWLGAYNFDYAAATRAVSEFFAAGQTHPSPEQPNAELRAVDLRVEQIARKLLGIPTLAERGSDQLDFHELSVQQIKLALRVAYEAGRNALR